MRIPNAHYLIVDLEATCTNDGSFPPTEMEIIEIGAVRQNARSLEIEDEFQTFIRPVRHRILTPFCTELTSITQSQVDDAPLFAPAIESFRAWFAPYDICFASWGDYDRKQFLQDCEFHGVAYPFPPGHLNVKAAFSQAQGVRKRFGLGQALKRLKLTFEGTPHRGIDDARNIARVVRAVLGGQ